MRRVMALWLPFWPAERRRSETVGEALPSIAERIRLVFVVERGVRRVTASCRGGWERGIRPGMPLVEARARLDRGEAIEFEHDAEGDRRAMRRLARWLLTLVPAVSLAEDARGQPARATDAHGLFADLSGCGRWLAWSMRVERSRSRSAGIASPMVAPAVGEAVSEAERDRLEMIHRALAERGISSRLAVAGTPGSAWAIARFGCGESPFRVVPPGSERGAIAPLPVEGLRLDPGQAAILREVEVRTVADLMALDRDEVADRFRPPRDRATAGREEPVRAQESPGIPGQEKATAAPRRSSPRFCGGHAPARLARAVTSAGRSGDEPRGTAPSESPSPLDRLDQALGRMDEPLVPFAVERLRSIETSFAGPVTDGETIALAFADLLDRLCRRLRRADRAARSLRLKAIPVRGDPWIIPVELGHPSRRPGHLWTIVRPLVEALPLGSRRSRRSGTEPAEGFDSVSIEVVRAIRTPATGPDRDLAGLGPDRRRDRGRISATRIDFVPAAECLDLLIARFGSGCIEVARAVAGHRPDGEFRTVPWTPRHGDGPSGREAVDPDSAMIECRPAGPTWRPPRPEPLLFVADAVIRWRESEHPIRRIGPAEVFLNRWWDRWWERWWDRWTGTPRADGDPACELVARRIERNDGLWLWIVRDRDPRERLSAVDVAFREGLDAGSSPACRVASWRVIGIGA
jgi:hypothetical protein